jgi:hypothetical protein
MSDLTLTNSKDSRSSSLRGKKGADGEGDKDKKKGLFGKMKW